MIFKHFSLQNAGKKVLVQSCIRQDCFTVAQRELQCMETLYMGIYMTSPYVT